MSRPGEGHYAVSIIADHASLGTSIKTAGLLLGSEDGLEASHVKESHTI